MIAALSSAVSTCRSREARALQTERLGLDPEAPDLAAAKLGHLASAAVVEISSRPSSPWTTSACAEPRRPSAWASGSTQRASNTPTS